MSILAYVGIDAHESSHSICVLESGSSAPVLRMKIDNDPDQIGRVFRKLSAKYDLRCCYEASSGGYVLQRQLDALGICCDVIAPSLIPKKPGDRIKTDNRDALNLAQLYRSDQLTVVSPPTPEQEAARRLTRMREQSVRDVVETKNQLNRFLGGLDRRYQKKSRWTQAHWKWLRGQTFDDDLNQFVFDELIGVLTFKLARLAEVERKVLELAASPAYKKMVDKLCCLKGVGLVTAMTLIAEIIDFDRFPSATALMSYLGLVPKENSSGNSRKQGGITKCGNAHCRRVLVEAAWKYARKPNLSATLKSRQQHQPATVVAHSWKAQTRLYKKFHSVAGRKPRAVAAVATARELIGFIWSIMTDRVTAA